jgi:acyl-CoA synthetase (AMP-forming)/AMP-acid ligase II
MVTKRDTGDGRVGMQGSRTLESTLAYWAATQPDAPFLIDAETGRGLDYAACWRAVCGLRRWLGATPQTLLVALPGGVETGVVWLAALTGGHCIVPCAPDSTPAEYVRLAKRWEPDLFIGEAANGQGRMRRLARRLLTPHQLRDEVQRGIASTERGVLAPAQCESELLLTTSGTTGTPKGVRLQARQIAWTADQIRISHVLTPSDRGLCVLPFFHINAPVVSLCATLMAGGAVVIAPRFHLSEFWSLMERERITWASIVPTIVALLLQSDGPATPPSHLRFVRTASAPLPVAHLRAFERRFRIPVIETYGLSEAASTVTANPVPPDLHKPGSVGLPLGLALRICAPAPDRRPGPVPLRDVAPGDEGEICVCGPSVISGYEGGVSDASFVDGWLRTGDLGYRDEDGYVFITGRLRDVINHGGHKIAPREVEEVLLAHPSVRDVVVVGSPDPIYGQRVVAYVVVQEDAGSRGRRRAHEAPVEQTLRAYCAGQLSAHKVPAEFVTVAALPRSMNGKIQRHALAHADDMDAQVQVPAQAFIGLASA